MMNSAAINRPKWPWLVTSGLVVTLGALGLFGWSANTEASRHASAADSLRLASVVDGAAHDAALADIHRRVIALESERDDLVADVTRVDAALADHDSVEADIREEAALIEADKQAAFDAPVEAKAKPVKKKRTKKTKRAPSKPKVTAPKVTPPKDTPEPPPAKKPGRSDRIDLPESRDPLAGL